MGQRRSEPKQRLYGAVLRVSDLSGCRAFYEEAVGLGPPAVDSNFWVEFEILPGRMILALERSPGPAQRHGPGSAAWCLEVRDLTAFARRMEEREVWPFRSGQLPCGRRSLTYLDPEQNPFLVIEAPDHEC